MITYYEILKRFSQILGIAESDGRLCIEIFARTLSQKNEYGDEIEIHTLGFFSLKKMKSDFGEENESQNVLLFSEERISPQNKNVLIFFLPEQKSIGFSSIDAHLNLSLGKPLFDSEKIKNTEFLQPSNTNELMALVESKVEKLISQSTICKHVTEVEQEYSFPKISEENIAGVEKTDDLIATDLGKELEGDAELASAQIDSVNTDGFELVGSEHMEPYDELTTENQEKQKWIFDDTALKNEIENQEDNAEISENYFVQTEQTSELALLDKRKSILKMNETVHVHQKKKLGFSKKLVFGIIIFMLLAASSIAVYLNYDKVKNFIANYTQEQVHVDENRKTAATNVIERTSEFLLPSVIVLNDSNLRTLDDSMIIASEVYGLRPDSLSPIKNEYEQKGSATLVSADALVKVGDNIYKMGSEYIVQVSSWRSQVKAESELKKLKTKGYHAKLEEFTSADLGTVYRVRVSGFKSITEANNFLNLNQ